jgi:hypothetical protein
MALRPCVTSATRRGKPGTWIVVLALALCANRAAAQTFHGTVRDSASHQPIAGAVFMLLDSSGVVLGRRITDEHGQYGIVVTGAPRWARVVRIGFRPREVRLSGAVDGAAPYDLAMLPVPTMLAAVKVRDQSHCGKRSDRAAALGLWEQARAGLLATVVARETNTAWVQRLVFERTFDGASDKITRFTVQADSAKGAGKSFNAVLSAHDFIATGFSRDSAGENYLFGPDADVLLDDAFAAGYCFRLASKVKSRPTQVGLSFSPSGDIPLRGRVDIDGTLWVDTAARAIRDIEYRYLGLPHVFDEYHPGGLISFRQMPHGIVMIDRWYIRNVGAWQDTIVDLVGPHARTWLFASESGGDLAHATWPDGSGYHAALGSLRIHAVAADGAPARGATITLPGTPFQGIADSSGDIRIADLEPGPYSVEMRIRPLADIGIYMPEALKFVAVRDSTHFATLHVPTAAKWVSDRCIADRLWQVGDSVFVIGRALNARGSPVAGIKLEYLVQSTKGLWTLLPDFYVTGTDGVFQTCNAEYYVGDTLRIKASMPGRTPFVTAVPLRDHVNAVLIHVPPAP